MSDTTTLTSRSELYIAGAWSSDAERAWIEVENPATEQVIGRIPEATARDVDRAVDAAVALHKSGAWRDTTLADRADVLTEIAEGIDKRAADLQALYVTDQGGLSSFAGFTSATASMIFRDTARLASSLDLGPTKRDTPGGSVYISREPSGPVAAIAPWNAPLVLSAVKIAPALLAGCPVVLKISPETPLTLFVLAEVFSEAGLPDGLISFLPGGRDVGQYLISRPGISHISFTGSTAAGQQVMRTAAERMTRLTLELGGKSAALVLDDAEPHDFVASLTRGSVVQTGQVCTTQSRILVPNSREAEWIDALTAAFETLAVGDPSDPSTEVGPLVSQAQVDRVESYVTSARNDGATVLTGGGRPSGPGFDTGYWFLPTLLTNTGPEMRVYREEVFGPVIVIEGYDTLDDGIDAVNDTEFGLGNGIYSPDVDRALALAPRLDSGTVSINTTGACITAPFGGMKMSGFGREGGIEGIEAMLESKQIQLP
ncbi:aldehyde dehydrogenase [Geodermatophilus sabuli]|uniref:Acyl-CoA reductase n=1 Tax=Geodermatophilus sabuli TaxID=1564158 RepID=A0A285EAK0_9ACTN|nr:aldehyde dehydrogenase [Geodermatophilus sabuli]MBB3085561.1 acyl-CoA reductase-like NAD-dependent aldehyde dehydrogenase [Geodermatophilus sabuli]SNX96017.1 Acyl-CoA reductase [Geodermatophilus sabuli]